MGHGEQRGVHADAMTAIVPGNSISCTFVTAHAEQRWWWQPRPRNANTFSWQRQQHRRQTYWQSPPS